MVMNFIEHLAIHTPGPTHTQLYSQSFYYDRADVALPNFAKYFKKAADEEYEHAQKFMKHQNNRGGQIILKPIEKPEKNEWGSGLDGIATALALERRVNQSLLDLHAVAGKHNDVHTSDFIEGNFLLEQVEAIKELAGHMTNLERVGAGHGEYHFERESLH